MTDQYILNQNEGLDVLHRSKGLTERCNVDDAKGKTKVDPLTADGLAAAQELKAAQQAKATRGAA